MHPLGYPCDIDRIAEAVGSRNIIIIEDAAGALGAKYGERKVGGISDFGCLSFNGNKIVTAGSGGALVSNDGDAIFENSTLHFTIQSGCGLQA